MKMKLYEFGPDPIRVRWTLQELGLSRRSARCHTAARTMFRKLVTGRPVIATQGRTDLFRYIWMPKS
jgi:hypothetical protein